MKHHMGQRRDNTEWRISSDFGHGVTVNAAGEVCLNTRQRIVTPEIGRAIASALEFARSLNADDLRGYDE